MERKCDKQIFISGYLDILFGQQDIGSIPSWTSKVIHIVFPEKIPDLQRFYAILSTPVIILIWYSKNKNLVEISYLLSFVWKYLRFEFKNLFCRNRKRRKPGKLYTDSRLVFYFWNSYVSRINIKNINVVPQTELSTTFAETLIVYIFKILPVAMCFRLKKKVYFDIYEFSGKRNGVFKHVQRSLDLK